MRLARFKSTDKSEFIDNIQIHGHFLIANVCFRRGIIEQCIKAGQPEPEFIEQANTFIVRLTTKAYLGNQTMDLAIQHLTDRQQEIMKILQTSPSLAVREIVSQMQHPPQPVTLRKHLTILQKMGYLESKGRGISARWSIKSKIKE